MDMTLEAIIEDTTRRAALIGDAVLLVDREVAAKGGLSGMAIKGAYKVVKAIKPGIITEAVDRLMDDFAAKLEPYYVAFAAEGAADFSRYLTARQAEVSNALLGVTDEKIARAQNATIKKAYEKLRPTAQKHVEAAVPGVGALIQKHAQES